MKKVFLLAAVCLAGFTSVKAQSFKHGVGLGVFVDKAKDADVGSNFAFSYSPVFNFIEGDESSLSIGIPLSVGFSGSYNASYNSRDGYSESSGSASFMFNAPLMLNFNMGAGSSQDSESRFGFFVGAGYAFHTGTAVYTVTDGDGYEYSESGSKSTTGPAANAGVRIGVGSGSHNIEVKASYMKGLTSHKPHVFGILAYFNF